MLPNIARADVARLAPDIEEACLHQWVEPGVQARSLRERFPKHGIEAEVYVTAPGSEIAEDHPLVGAIDEAHEQVFGQKPERDTVRWFSDASALTRYGIESVNYGTSSGLPDAELGENLDIDGLVKTADVYARVAQRICEVA